MREQARGGAAQLEHAAVFYADEDEYLDEVLGFVGAGLDDGDLVFVAVPGPKVGMLREHLAGHAGQVTFADMTQLGANPAWIIPRVRAFIDANPGRQVRYVGEPIWETRSAEELCEATRHEALINLAFAGVPISILCPYDTRLGQGVIAKCGAYPPCGHPGRAPAPQSRLHRSCHVP